MDRKRIWGWYFFDWSSQPFATLILTFIFAPYVAEVLGDGSRAQAAWGFGVAAAGILIAVLAPILGALADTGGNRVRWVAGFSVLYVIGSAGLWFAEPGDFDLFRTILLFGVGLVAMEFATIFTNAMLPDLGPREEIGRISGNGWAFGYLGGLLSLVIMLLFFAENAATGKTLIGLDPLLGLDAAAREGTRAVGPLTAIWFAVFMVPFFVWVRDPRRNPVPPGAVGRAMRDLLATLRSLPGRTSLTAYLASSMFYRDALNGMYTFGGIYAAGVLGWSVVDTGIFGILAIITGALFAWLGGRADSALGPKPVIRVCILILTAVAVLVVFISRDNLFGIRVAEASRAPDIAFYILGALIGAAGGSLQAASRSMMVRQADPDRMTEAFGLYALAGKATSFIAPLSIGIVTSATGSQQAGIVPLIVLFLIGLFLLWWVKPDGDRAVP
ncbi:MFS transporter [Ovoidimarina sediminis]|uniref:MFS transporter n=1 Tax=Ovoidimarina sediminis TaxID=3079856 RepID=UPI00290C7594|nr:MFS transporter [Rhodophyticola sp. MJ-SS7]MDU8942456.1 MFS transporter [Rhodophyticola sp. MJ-SS7]